MYCTTVFCFIYQETFTVVTEKVGSITNIVCQLIDLLHKLNKISKLI
jgi:hypothetical protein